MSDTTVNIVNKVLKKLRESEVNTVDGDDYAELITDFLSETKREVEDAYNWSALEGTVLLDTTANTYRYKLVNVYERSIIHDIYCQTNDHYVTYSPKRVKEGLKYATPETGDPLYWDFVGYNDSEMLIDLFPVPDANDIRFYVNGKFVQGDLAYSSAATDLVLTPTQPLILGTYAKAVEERGEDDGEAFTKAEAKFQRALSDAIALEESLRKGENTTWSVE